VSSGLFFFSRVARKAHGLFKNGETGEECPYDRFQSEAIPPRGEFFT